MILEAFPLGVGTWLPLGSRTKRRLAVLDAAESLQDSVTSLSRTPWPVEGAVVSAESVSGGVEVRFTRPNGSLIFSVMVADDSAATAES